MKRSASRAQHIRRLTLVLIVLLCACQNSNDRSGDKVLIENKELTQGEQPQEQGMAAPGVPAYSPLGHGTFPIGAWIAPPPPNVLDRNNPSYITDDSYALVKEAGLNMIYGLYERMEMNADDIMRALDAAHNNGLYYVVGDAAIQAASDDPELMEDSVRRYSEHPAFLGHMVMDEPSSRYFEMLGANYEEYRKRLPDKMFYLNLLPTYASKNQLKIDKGDGGGGEASIDDYRAYLADFMESVNPPYISYDYYPLEGPYPELKSGYFENMSLVRSIAMQYEVPFWVFVQTTSWAEHIRVATPAELAWQVHTALAYGAQGMQYFTFWEPMESGFTGGIVSRTGEKLPIFDTVQQLNAFISDIGAYLMRARSLGLMAVGESPVPIPQSDRLTSCEGIESVTAGQPLLVGCFEMDGLNAYYLVNLSVEHANQVAIRYSDDSEYWTYGLERDTSGKTMHKDGELTIGPGQGVFVINRLFVQGR